jgi:hypothetical protein
MIVLKDFKTTNQVFKVGDELYDNIENLEHWVAGEFVTLEKFVGDSATPVVAAPVVATPVVVTEVPAATFA